MQERSNLENSLNIYSEIKNELVEISELIDLYSNESQSSEQLEEEILVSLTELSERAEPVSYTHLTLPTIYSV